MFLCNHHDYSKFYISIFFLVVIAKNITYILLNLFVYIYTFVSHGLAIVCLLAGWFCNLLEREQYICLVSIHAFSSLYRPLHILFSSLHLLIICSIQFFFSARRRHNNYYNYYIYITYINCYHIYRIANNLNIIARLSQTPYHKFLLSLYYVSCC